MTKDQRNATQDHKLTLRASQNARDLERSRLGQRNAQRYLDARQQPLHNWTAIGQAIIGAIAVLLFLYFLLA